MNILIEPSGGASLALRPRASPAWYPVATVTPVQAEVWWRYEGDPPRAARLIGVFSPGQQVSIPYNPLVDRNIIVSTISISAKGVRSVRSIDDAHEELITFQRETSAPTLTQVGTATNSLITLTVDGFSSLAIKRKVRTADNSGMTTNLSESITTVSPGDILPRIIYLNRPSPGTGTRTIYAAVSHSSGGDFGAESTPAAFTWADSGGSGGTGGGGDPYGGDPYPCFSGNVKVMTPHGPISFEQMINVGAIKIINKTGLHPAELVTHYDFAGRMIDMGEGELVTLEHLFKTEDGDWKCAAEHFADRPRVDFKGTVFNLHILSNDPTDFHYILANGEIAHNIKPNG